jgi:hypothetical protein
MTKDKSEQSGLDDLGPAEAAVLTLISATVARFGELYERHVKAVESLAAAETRSAQAFEDIHERFRDYMELYRTRD